MRIHPGIIAPAAATSAAMMPGRFFLGVGTGENLTEHIFGDRWPTHDIREAMLEEAVAIIRMLWQGDSLTYCGEYYMVKNVRLYTLPDQLPPFFMAASGPRAAEAAGRLADGLITTAAETDILKGFEGGGGWANRPMVN